MKEKVLEFLLSDEIEARLKAAILGVPDQIAADEIRDGRDILALMRGNGG